MKFECRLSEVTVHTTNTLKPPEIGEDALLSDARILGPALPVQYKSTNWLTTNALYANLTCGRTLISCVMFAINAQLWQPQVPFEFGLLFYPS